MNCEPSSATSVHRRGFLIVLSSEMLRMILARVPQKRGLLCSLQPPSAKAFYTTGGACEVGGFSLGADAPESHPKQLQGFRFLRLLRVPVLLAMAYVYICMASERMYAFIYERMNVCMHVCLYVCMFVCLYVCMSVMSVM